jgi:hypothetical protein
LPGALDTIEPRLAQRPEMRLDALNKPVAGQETAVWFEQIMDRPVAGENLFGVAQIVQSDGGDSEIEGAADLLWP